MKTTIKVQCPSCRGTGVYHGLAEPPGVAVICNKCDGKGCADLTYDTFEGRQTRSDIQTVNRRKPDGFGATGVGIPYQDFLVGRMP